MVKVKLCGYTNTRSYLMEEVSHNLMGLINNLEKIVKGKVYPSSENKDILTERTLSGKLVFFVPNVKKGVIPKIFVGTDISAVFYESLKDEAEISYNYMIPTLVNKADINEEFISEILSTSALYIEADYYNLKINRLM